jgi:hypothetical protein
MKPFSLDDSTLYYKNTTQFCATLMGSAFAGLVVGTGPGTITGQTAKPNKFSFAVLQF